MSATHRDTCRESFLIESAEKIWDIERTAETDRKHQAHLDKQGTGGSHGEMHTDLFRYKDHWYCSFKEELFPRSRIIRSADGKNWETVKVFTWGGAYVAEVKFGVTAEGWLMGATTVQFGRMGRNDSETHVGRQSVSWLSEDGVNWSSAYAPASGINNIRYDFTWYQNMGYSLAYCGRDHAGTLYRTRDGKDWRVLASEVFPEAHRGCYEEASLAFDPQTGDICALVRANPVCAIIGTAPAPDYQNWTWREAQVDLNGNGQLQPASVLGNQLGGPKIRRLSDGRLLAVGKADASTETENLGRNDLFWMDPQTATLTRFAALDGYMHYAGIYEHDGMIWVSCGKREPFAVYLLKVRIPPEVTS